MAVRCALWPLLHDGARILTASADGLVKEWEAKGAASRPLRIIKVPGGRLWSAAFNIDGSRIVTASDDNKARIWDAETGETLVVFSGESGKNFQMLDAEFSSNEFGPL